MINRKKDYEKTCPYAGSDIIRVKVKIKRIRRLNKTLALIAEARRTTPIADVTIEVG